MKQYAFGVDIGGTTVKMGLFRTTGELLETWEIPTDTSENGKNILGDIAKSVEEHRKENQLAESEIKGIGMGVPGPVSADGTVLKCVNLGWDVFNVEEKLSELTGYQVKAGNDANVAALGEMWQGGGKGFHDMVMVTLGTGVGGGIILGERILAGVTGAAGEIGHIHMMDHEEECCGCGNKGCLEQYASANGIVRLAQRYLQNHPEMETTLGTELTSKEIWDKVKENDKAAVEIAEQMSDLLGKALAAIACVVNPEAFVIGGGMSKAGEILLEYVQKAYVKYAFHASRNAQFKLAQLGNNAGIYGGVKLVL